MDYDQFIASYALILRQCVAMLRDNRFLCLVVADIRDRKGMLRDFVGDTIDAVEAAGARLYNEAIIATPPGTAPVRAPRQFDVSRKLAKTHQNLLIFAKGDPKEAAGEIGDLRRFPIRTDILRQRPATAISP